MLDTLSIHSYNVSYIIYRTRVIVYTKQEQEKLLIRRPNPVRKWAHRTCGSYNVEVVPWEWKDSGAVGSSPEIIGQRVLGTE